MFATANYKMQWKMKCDTVVGELVCAILKYLIVIDIAFGNLLLKIMSNGR